MKIIHTADVHLDASFAASGMPPGYANRRRQSLRDCFHGMMKRARDWQADAVLIAGDLFEADRISRDTVAFLRNTFESLGAVPVFIAPGNHDPFIASSPYATELWPANVHVFAKPVWETVMLPDCPLTVHGFGFDGYQISSNPFGTLEPAHDGRVQVAVAHGSERTHQPPDKESYAPFDAETAAPEGLHYLALGHFHSLTQIKGAFGAVMYYPGAPEGHGFKETGPHYYLELEIEPEQGQAPEVRVTPRRASSISYLSERIDISSCSDSHQVVQAVRNLAEGSNDAVLARVLLHGSCVPGLREELDTVQDAAEEAFEYLQVMDDTEPEEDYLALARETTSLGAFLHRMNEEIEAAPDPKRRAVLVRAREVGLAAYRGRQLPLRGTKSAGA